MNFPRNIGRGKFGAMLIPFLNMFYIWNAVSYFVFILYCFGLLDAINCY